MVSLSAILAQPTGKLPTYLCSTQTVLHGVLDTFIQPGPILEFTSSLGDLIPRIKSISSSPGFFPCPGFFG
jgi:hypothetical protein